MTEIKEKTSQDRLQGLPSCTSSQPPARRIEAVEREGLIAMGSRRVSREMIDIERNPGGERVRNGVDCLIWGSVLF